ncbi:hypothetical protein Cni_G26986 [Canna indica]|uniref:Pentatricopeptide repeat-containing protein n=1 Tax=Canna indica TaxID=4628 RepID=A0AAQ3QQZ0_9LILI|nr:hypothetical protein Cni_G26986 [Canna indica]
MKQLKQLHAHLISQGLLHESPILGKLIAFCAVSGSGDLLYGRRLFDRVSLPNTFMWNSLIRGYSNSRSPREALVLHCRMLRCGLLSNQFTLPFVLKSCASVLALLEASMVHALIFKLGFESQIFVANALLSAYSSCGLIELARKVFDEIPNRNVVSWNSMIGGYSQMGDCKQAFNLFRAMRNSDVGPDGFTFASILSACAEAKNVDLGRATHHYIVVTGATVDLIAGNALVDMYGKWAIPDEATLVAVLSACSQIGDLVIGKETHNYIAQNIANPSVSLLNSLVDMYAKCGSVGTALDVFWAIPQKTVVSWNIIIGAYAMHGCAIDAIDLFMQMTKEGFSPDTITFTGLLCACSHASSPNSDLIQLIRQVEYQDSQVTTNQSSSHKLLNKEEFESWMSNN